MSPVKRRTPARPTAMEVGWSQSPMPTSRRSRIKPKAAAPSRARQRALLMQATLASTAARPLAADWPSSSESASTLTGAPAGPHRARPTGQHLKTIVSKASGDVLARQSGSAECSNEPQFMRANAEPLNPRHKPACESLFAPRPPRRLLPSALTPPPSPRVSKSELADELLLGKLKVSRCRMRIPMTGGDAAAKPLDLVLVLDRFSMGILASALVSVDRNTAEVVSTLLNRGLTNDSAWRARCELAASGKGVLTPLLAR